jgi:uncharacterized repeat protein (TIGR01451 family)
MARPNRTQTIHVVIVALVLLSLLVPASGSQAAARPAAAKAATAAIIDIPVATSQVAIDGFCDTGKEYAKALVETFKDGNGQNATVYIFSDGSQLYVCMQAQVAPYSKVFGRVYLDPQGDGSSYVYAGKDDDAFQLTLAGSARSSYIGTYVPNGWELTPPLDPDWSGKASKPVGATMETYEFALNQKLLNFGFNCSVFGLSVFHHWFHGVGDDYSWPAGSIFDQPRTWQLMRINSGACARATIAYVYRGNKDDAASFYNLLTANGYTVDLIPLSAITAAAPDFTVYKLIVIADDTGQLNDWGSTGLTTDQVNNIKSAKKPILGLGEGGYAFFGRLSLFIGWPQGWHGPQNIMNKAATAPAGYFPSTPLTHYVNPFNSVGIYLNPNQTLPADVTPIGLEDPLDNHAALIQQGCDFLWGNSGNPLIMTSDGKLIFLKTVSAAYGTVCKAPAPPNVDCRNITKTSNVAPTVTSPVASGQQITYTLHYTYGNFTPCSNPSAAKIIDFVPPNTTFVPGSATGGITPGPDGALVWSVTPSAAPALSRTLSFSVRVAGTACPGPTTLSNQASLLVFGYASLTTAALTNTVTCPVLVFPSHSPFYAEDELQVSPYPLAAGHPTQVSVRLTNTATTAVNAIVQFQVSPQGLGAGLPYTTFATRTALIPGSSSILLTSSYTPASAGLACFQASVMAPGVPPALTTQSCIDNMEDFSTQATNNLTFKVGNPTASTANIMLVVDNTCPGWTASITSPATGTLTAVLPNDTDIRNATLHVTRPTPATLGSGCHIDVQAWIGTQMIGGLRKLDVPPVHLPSNITPPWEEPEITFVPDPPVLGAAGQVCLELNNPTGSAKSVTLQFDEADFGAGISFTPFATQTFVLPAHSVNRYCVPYTPRVTGTAHRCILVHLIQAGYREMTSQHNVNLVRGSASLSTLDIPFTIGNPDLVGHHLTFTLQTTGLSPLWMPVILPSPGDPPIDMIPAGGTLTVHLQFTGGVVAQVTQAPPGYSFGDSTRVSVGVLLDGQPTSGFTILLPSTITYFPAIKKAP